MKGEMPGKQKSCDRWMENIIGESWMSFHCKGAELQWQEQCRFCPGFIVSWRGLNTLQRCLWSSLLVLSPYPGWTTQNGTLVCLGMSHVRPLYCPESIQDRTIHRYSKASWEEKPRYVPAVYCPWLYVSLESHVDFIFWSWWRVITFCLCSKP